VGYAAVQFLRSTFDLFTGYGKDMTEAKYLQRFLYLETVAGVCAEHSIRVLPGVATSHCMLLRRGLDCSSAGQRGSRGRVACSQH
jgi:Alternative oxidase